MISIRQNNFGLDYRQPSVRKYLPTRVVVVVKWSVCLSSSQTIRVRKSLKATTVFLKKMCLKRTKINKNEAGVDPFFKNYLPTTSS